MGNDKATNSALDFEAIFSEEQMRKSESEYNSTWGTKRRLMTITLTKSSNQLLEGFKEDDSLEHIIALAEQVEEFKKHLEAGIQLAECAMARLESVAIRL